MSSGLVWTLVMGTAFMAVLVTVFTWTNHRIRVNRPIPSRQRWLVMSLLVVNLLLFWYLCIILD